MLTRRLPIHPAGAVSRPHPTHPFRGLRSGFSALHHGDVRSREPQNEHDGVLMSRRDPAARARLTIALRLTAEPGARAGNCDNVLG
jgi:hypothetical protein